MSNPTRLYIEDTGKDKFIVDDRRNRLYWIQYNNYLARPDGRESHGGYLKGGHKGVYQVIWGDDDKGWVQMD